jgi:DNA-binding response OmpR family regulator
VLNQLDSEDDSDGFTRRPLLVVDDDAAVREALAQVFSRDGYLVTAVPSGQQALAETDLRRFDLIILDVALGASPNGYQVCRILRDRGLTTPIIMLTGLGSEADAVHGLDTGADDYVRKPVGVAQLRSRAEAILRRSNRDVGKEPIVAGRVVLDRQRQLVTVDGDAVTLTAAEFALLTALMSRAGEAIPRQELLEHMWGPDPERDIRSIDLHVRHLRAKLGDDLRAPRLIVSVSGQGYRLRTR